MGMTNEKNGILRTDQKVIFGRGLGDLPYAVFNATGGEEHDAADELAFFGFDMLVDVLEHSMPDDAIDPGPGIFVWEGLLVNSGDMVRVPGGPPRPVMQWSGKVRRALPEEVLEINDDLVPSPFAAAS